VNKSEDYLDSLLNNVTPERKGGSKRRRRKRKADFEEDFENELSGAGMDDFMQAIETEVDNPEMENGPGDSFFDELEGIINHVKEPEEKEPEVQPQEDAFEINTLADDTWTEPQEKEESQEEDFLEEESGINESQAEEPQVELFDASAVDELLEQENGGASKKKKEKKAENGFFKKLGAALFGDDEEEPAGEDAAPAAEETGYGGGDMDGLDDENLRILQELDMAGAPPKEEPADVPSKKEKKKKEKKMKKEKKPKEKKVKEKKPKKPKKAKAPKEKKPKKAKPVDLSPPLPKAPVILIFIMAVSGTLFILLSSNLLGYSASIKEARQAYASMDYVEAYRQIAGVEPKAEDEEFAGRLLLLAGVQGELNNANALYDSGQFTMALDAYICALGRYDANCPDAAAYGAQAEYDVLASEVTAQMSEKFGVSAETAREIYGLSDRTEYTRRVYHIVKALGLIS